MLDVVSRLEAANLAVRESFASNSSAGTPQAVLGRSEGDGASTPGYSPHLTSSCESPSPNPRPTSAVATYDQAALAAVPPSPFAAVVQYRLPEVQAQPTEPVLGQK